MRRGLTLLLLSGLALVARPAEPQPSSLAPAALRAIGIEQRIGERVPMDVVLADEHGRRAPLASHFGERPVVLVFHYTDCPMLCSLVLHGLTMSLKTLALDAGRDFDVLAVSFDPGERPERAAAQRTKLLERYGRAGAETGIRFLTGDEDAIARLASAVGFRYAWDPALRQYAHPAAIMVLTPEGRVARYFYGSEYPPRDLRLALVEASAGGLGRLTDELLLLCYRYDPHTGRYSASALGAVRLGGAATLGLVAAFVGASLWRERRRRSGRRVPPAPSGASKEAA
jgi:protein SCO1/2